MGNTLTESNLVMVGRLSAEADAVQFFLIEKKHLNIVGTRIDSIQVPFVAQVIFVYYIIMNEFRVCKDRFEEAGLRPERLVGLVKEWLNYDIDPTSLTFVNQSDQIFFLLSYGGYLVKR
jgi:hypothetical protein